MRHLTPPIVITLAALVASALVAGPVQAEPTPPPGWFMPVGLNLGLSAPLEGDAGFLLGGELSAVYLFGTAWSGLYADALHDFGPARTRLGAGAEVGWFLFGLEAGYVAEVGDGRAPEHGVRGGGVISSSFMTGYARWVHLRGQGPRDVIELGVLLKWPLQL